ncbi:MAG: diguanylate cyclase [Deltaproteobacteria bacterium]|nr:diguanylate cyclase [Deltaproteobacteria bacterium]
MIEKLPFYRRITVRLIALFGLLTLIGTLAGAYTSIQLAKREFFHVMERQFNATSSLAENSLDIIGQMARAWALYFAGDASLPDRLHGANHAFISQEIEHMRESAHCDTVIVLDHQGRIIHHSAFDEKNGESLMAWQIVRQAVNEGKSSYAIIEEQGNFIVYGSGITSARAANKRGAHPYIVLTGFKISDELVANLSQDTSIGMTFVRRSAVMASSLSTTQRKLIDIPIPYLDYQTMYNDPMLTKEVQIDGQVFYASVRQLNILDPSMDGSLLLTYPRKELYTIVERLQREYLWLYAAGMLLFALFMWRISYRTMEPLRKLAERVKQVAKGDMTPTVIEKRDEIGIIASSFNDLLSELIISKQRIERHAEDLEQQVEQRTRELHIANEELARQALYDTLTNLPNRRLFNDRLQQAIALAHRGGSSAALMFIDLDRFKWVNDTFGHDVGDELLKEASRRILSCLRESDTVARMGGDEFTVILTQPGALSDIEYVASRILKNLTAPFDLSGAENIQISGSIGIAIYPENGDTAAQLLLRADHAMYSAKKAGTAAYCFWQPSMEG